MDTQAYGDIRFKTKINEIHYAFDGIMHGGTLVLAATPFQLQIAQEANCNIFLFVALMVSIENVQISDAYFYHVF